MPPFTLLASILALFANVAVAMPTPQDIPINDTFSLLPSDVNSGPMRHCAGNPPPVERPESLAIERFSTEPSNAGIGVIIPFSSDPSLPFHCHTRLFRVTFPANTRTQQLHGFYDPMHLYLCSDGFDAAGQQIMHIATEIEIFDWDHHVILEGQVNRPPEYEGRVMFYFLSKQDWQAGKFMVGLKGTFGGQWRDFQMLVEKGQDPKPLTQGVAVELLDGAEQIRVEKL